jgi:uncharacterized protein
MLGTILNVAGILLGGVAGLRGVGSISPVNQSRIRIGLAVGTVVFGLGLTWRAVGGDIPRVARQLAVVFVSLILGNLTGRLLGLQNRSNRLGRQAREILGQAKPGPQQLGALQVGAILFCLSPLSFLGAWFDGQSGLFQVLLLKAIMDGLATQAFVGILGWRVMLSAIPVLACQGTITLVAHYVAWRWQPQPLILGSVEATGGLLIFCAALIILELKRVSLANYLPSLLFAPLLAWWWLR